MDIHQSNGLYFENKDTSGSEAESGFCDAANSAKMGKWSEQEVSPCNVYVFRYRISSWSRR